MCVPRMGTINEKILLWGRKWNTLVSITLVSLCPDLGSHRPEQPSVHGLGDLPSEVTSWLGPLLRFLTTLPHWLLAVYKR